MNILLVYPQHPESFWGFNHALPFVSKKASVPPLGLLTVAAMLPPTFHTKLVDMNAARLCDADIEWANYVFISAISVQEKSARDVIARCRALKTKIVAGGPLFTAAPEHYETVDHLVLNDAEVTLPPFLEDIEHNRAKHIYTSDTFPAITATPTPGWDLIRLKSYSTMSLQYSRGCPFNCEFCDITTLYGRKVRTKTTGQVLAELESLYQHGWRGGVFFVDDNFIGNAKKLKEEVLPAITDWMARRRYPFSFNTEVSINLADDEELMTLMVGAGFNTVFVGIETPNEESLKECRKHQNRNRDLLACVKAMQDAGLQVQAGFIVGFDSDPPAIFERIIAFIRDSRIITAMVGLLNAPRGTTLYKRLHSEGRLLHDMTGSNTDLSMNFVPKMEPGLLMRGYKSILGTIYSPVHYYARVRRFLKDYRPVRHQERKPRFELNKIGAFVKSIFILGIRGKERRQYWHLLAWALFRRPRLLPLAITFAIYGYHFRKIIRE